MGLKTSTMYRPGLQQITSTESTQRNKEEDSLRFAFSLPCSPTPGFGAPLERTKSNSVTNLVKPLFCINTYNGTNIIITAFEKLGWTRSTERRINNCAMKWTENVYQIDYQAFIEGEQMVNHIPNCGLLTNKLGLLLSLRDYEQNIKLSDKNAHYLSMQNFVPETYCIDDSRDLRQFTSIHKDGQTWIYKPTCLNQGKGIQLIRTKAEFEKLQLERLEAIRKNQYPFKPRIIQRYIVEPLLLNDRKFDIRCYLMLVSTMPYLVLSHPGYVRVSTRKYDLEDNDLITHLTNQYIQKKDPKYAKMKEDTVWSMDRFNDYVNKHYVKTHNIRKDWVKTDLMENIQNISKHCFMAVKDKLACRIGIFEVLGMDFMIDSAMKVWLIEINSNPAMQVHCEVLRRTIPSMMTKFIEISAECFEKARRWRPYFPLRGVMPLCTIDDERRYSDKDWYISLKTDESGGSGKINGRNLPASFTLIYEESLAIAKQRISTSSQIPLRVWIAPTFPSFQSGESGRFLEKFNSFPKKELLPTSSSLNSDTFGTNSENKQKSSRMKPSNHFKPNNWIHKANSGRMSAVKSIYAPTSQRQQVGGSNRGLSQNLSPSSQIDANENCSILVKNEVRDSAICVNDSNTLPPIPPISIPIDFSDFEEDETVSSDSVNIHEENSEPLVVEEKIRDQS